MAIVAPRREVHAVEVERLDVADGRNAVAAEFPCRHVAEPRVVAPRLAVFGLELLAEVASARLAALERVEADQLPELEEVRDAARVLERLVELVPVAGHVEVLPEFLAPRAFLRPASLRAMPQSSHMIEPSSRWNEDGERCPRIDRSRLVRASISAAAAFTSGCSAVTFGSGVAAR